jgi:phenylacetyl-CoA:acceptor oxidoreductase subunit 2
MSFGPRPWLQQHWDWRAACNFMFGGAGAGLVVAAALLDGPHALAALGAGLALVAAGLAAVWLEIGRKLRAVHVFFNPFTSWMTRESFTAVLLFALGIAALATGSTWLRYGAAAAAAAFVFCQGRILHAAKGIPAWRLPEVVPLIVVTGLAEGATAALVFELAGAPVALAGLALIARALAWSRYRSALGGSAALAALAPAGRALVTLGTVAPLALLAFAFVMPESAWVAAAAAIAAGWRFKHALITRAAFNQGFALPRVPVRGARTEGGKP